MYVILPPVWCLGLTTGNNATKAVDDWLRASTRPCLETLGFCTRLMGAYLQASMQNFVLALRQFSACAV
jgi:hypothetical protein